MKNNIFKMLPELEFYAYEDEAITLMWERIDYEHIEALFKDDDLHMRLNQYIIDNGIGAKILKDYNDYNDYEDIMELLESEPLADIIDYIAYYRTEGEAYIIDNLLTTIGYQFGTVGYSQWSYFTAPVTYSYNYINDYYEGWNFYTVQQLDERGDVVDSLGGLYITDEGELLDTIDVYFNYEGTPYIVDNEWSAYFNVDKVREVVTYTSKFEVI